MILLWAAAALAQGPATPVLIHVAASKGQLIPQSKGGGFQRLFRFSAKPGRAGHWIRQALEVRGSVVDAKGATMAVHLDIVEYYRVGSSGRAIQPDTHFSPFRKHCGGALTIRSTLTYGTLASIKRGDMILGKSFILRGATNAVGKFVTMRTRKGQVIPAEHGERVTFNRHAGSVPTRYAYAVTWDACPGTGSRTRPKGAIEQGTWQMEAPKQSGTTAAVVRPQPIPGLR